MAKSVATCTCKVCNGLFTKIKSDCRNRREADSWEEWAKSNYDVCPVCYKKRMAEEQKERGLILKYDVAQFISTDGTMNAVIWFEGDTMTYKEQIKTLGGFRWDYLENSLKKCWRKLFPFNDVQTELNRILEILPASLEESVDENKLKSVLKRKQEIESYLEAKKSYAAKVKEIKD